MTVGQTPGACQLPRGRTLPAFTVRRGSQARLGSARRGSLARLDRQAVSRIAVVFAPRLVRFIDDKFNVQFRDDESSTGKKREEIQANMLAASLLMHAHCSPKK